MPPAAVTMNAGRSGTSACIASKAHDECALPQSAILFFAAVCGAGLMAIELSAVRLLAPWFGASTTVWTNVIAVVLVGLSLGYALGARFASGSRPARALGWTLAFAGAVIGWLPSLSRPVARAFLPEGLSLAEAGTLIEWGSLASASALFLAPSILLGLTTPLASEIHARARGASAGRAGGHVLAASTVGSLVGTFATPYWLVPTVGLRATYIGVALTIGALGIALLVADRAARSATIIGGAAILCALLSPRSENALAAGEQLLESVESPYQDARVVEVAADGLRYLRVNESFDSFQSVWSPTKGFLPDGFYYNAFAFPAWWDRRPGDWRVAIVGLGAGTVWRVLDGALPNDMRAIGLGAEIDAAVVDLARRWLDLGSDAARETWAGCDGRVALRSAPGSFDQIVVDAYANQTEIPPHLSSVEFFDLCVERLRPAGWISINVGAFGLDDPVLVAVATTLARAVRGRVLALAIPFSRNVALLARRAAEPPEPRLPAFRVGDPSMDRRLSAFELPGVWRWFEARETALTDDRNGILDLQRESISRAGDLP